MKKGKTRGFHNGNGKTLTLCCKCHFNRHGRRRCPCWCREHCRHDETEWGKCPKDLWCKKHDDNNNH